MTTTKPTEKSNCATLRINEVSEEFAIVKSACEAQAEALGMKHKNADVVRFAIKLAASSLSQVCRDAQDAKRDIQVPLSPSLVTTDY